MKTLLYVKGLKSFTSVALGAILLATAGQGIASAYQYPSLVSHAKYRIFLNHKVVKKSPAPAALRALPLISPSHSANLAPSVIDIPIEPAISGSYAATVAINYGDPTPVFSPLYSIPSTITLPSAPVCGYMNFAGTPSPTLTPGSYNVDCSFGSLPAFIHYDDGGAGINYVFTYPTTTVTVAPLSWTLAAQAASFTVGGTQPTLAAIATPSAGLSGTASCAIYATSDSTYATALSFGSLAAGTYTIHCTGSAATGYATPTVTNAVLTVNAATPAPVFGAVHTVSYSLAGGIGSIPSSVTAPTGTAFAVASGSGITKDGFTFGGWSDGSHTFAAGATDYIGSTDTVLTAVWNEIPGSASSTSGSSSSGSGGAQPIVVPKTPVTVPAAPSFTNHAVASNLVANFTKVVDLTSRTTAVAVPHDAGTSIRLTDGVQTSLNNELNLALTSNGVQVTAVKGWTGRISFPVIATQSGTEVELFVGVEEDPNPVISPTFSLVSTKQAQVTWTADSSQVELYNLYLGNSLACTTSKLSCTLPISSINMFKNALKIESVGHQTTYSTKVAPMYSLKSLVSAGIVHFNVGSATLTNTAKANLAQLVKTLKALGITAVNLNGHTDSTGADAVNKNLSLARVNSVKAYLAKAMPKLKFNGKGFSSTVPVSSNTTATGRSDNRRVEVLVG
jgi:outer membrane protein OmpA-like peptidoglycan-associated protein